MPAMIGRRIVIGVVFVFLALGSLVASAQEPPPPPPEVPAPGDPASETAPAAEPDALLGAWQERAAQQALIGAWVPTTGDTAARLVLGRDGAFSFDDLTGRYEIEGDRLILTNGAVVTYNWKPLDNGNLEISGGNLRGPITFAPEPRGPGYLGWLFDISPETLRERLQRILAIILIVIAARLFIYLARGVSHLLIFSEWGPLALAYRGRRNRAKTIHSLVLNIAKYFIYFTAFGMILAELGINYTTYIASLSVIGLAVGFGSQGLVQDMVTGFFIIFEGQFDVGDMVEIAGQTGVVTELGLRMTRVRNYLGQTVAIPNRNIATVANYKRGGQQALIDAAVADAAAAERELPVLKQLGEEIMKQFEGVVLPPIRAVGPLTLDTGETFVRLHLSIWPGQTWVVDQQVVPRLRERMQAAGIPIPADRVAAFYHAKESVPATGWRETLTWVRERLADREARPAKS